MITISVANNANKVDLILSGETTVRTAFSKAGIDPSRGLVSLDGARVSDLDYTLNQVGAVDGSVLMTIIKNDNANN